MQGPYPGVAAAFLLVGLLGLTGKVVDLHTGRMPLVHASPYRERMSIRSGAVRWPLTVDLAVAITAVLLVWLGTRRQVAETASERAVDGWAELLVWVTALFLLGARTAPWPTLLATSAGAAGYVALGYPGGPVLLVPWLALVALTVRRGAREGWAAASASLAMIAVGSVVAGTGDHWGRLLLVLGWSAASVLGGDVLGRRMAAAAVRRRLAEHRREVAATAERLQIARDAHDGLGHALSVIMIQTRVALQTAPDGPTADALEVIAETTSRALDDLGAMVAGLRHHVPRQPVHSLRDVEPLLERSQAAGDQLTWHLSIGQQWPGPVQSAAFRVVQEALTNARRHAPGARISVELGDAEGPLVVRICNEHSLVSIQARTASADGLGLVGMNERVVATGGSLATGGAPDGGWQVSAEWRPRG